MSGISRISALEIFTRPDDLYVSVGGEGRAFSFLIGRGPGHNHKVIVSTDPAFESKGTAIEYVRQFLIGICDIMKKEVTNSDNLVAKISNPGNLPESEMDHILTPAIIDRIITDLKEKNHAETHTYGEARV